MSGVVHRRRGVSKCRYSCKLRNGVHRILRACLIAYSSRGEDIVQFSAQKFPAKQSSNCGSSSDLSRRLFQQIPCNPVNSPIPQYQKYVSLVSLSKIIRPPAKLDFQLICSTPSKQSLTSAALGTFVRHLSSFVEYSSQSHVFTSRRLIFWYLVPSSETKLLRVTPAVEYIHGSCLPPPSFG